MKTLILMIVAITFMVYNSSAQKKEGDLRGKIIFGAKVGANYSNVYDTQGEEFDADPKFGLAAGAFLAIPIGEAIGVQPELLYSQKGFQATGRILESTYKFTRTTSYLDVPLLFAFKPSKVLTLLAGPQYSYLISKKDVFDNGTTTVAQEQEFKNDNIRKNTLCFKGGFDINADHLVFSARVGWDILNNNGNGTSTTPRYKNVWYQATFGYRFY